MGVACSVCARVEHRKHSSKCNGRPNDAFADGDRVKIQNVVCGVSVCVCVWRTPYVGAKRRCRLMCIALRLRHDNKHEWFRLPRRGKGDEWNAGCGRTHFQHPSSSVRVMRYGCVRVLRAPCSLWLYYNAYTLSWYCIINECALAMWYCDIVSAIFIIFSHLTT